MPIWLTYIYNGYFTEVAGNLASQGGTTEIVVKQVDSKPLEVVNVVLQQAGKDLPIAVGATVSTDPKQPITYAQLKQ